MATIVYIGLAISFLSAIGLAVYAATQIRMRKEVEHIPVKLEEWKAQYRIRRFYFLLAQVLGIIIAFVGLMI